MIRFNYYTHDDMTTVDVHVTKKAEAKLFSENDKNKEEFLLIESIDLEQKEMARFFIAGESLDQFIEQMSAICALRFKK
jgi:hypothetical protein